MPSAIIETGGKQYRVDPGQIVTIEKLELEVGATVTFSKVLMVIDGAKTTFGTPTVANLSVVGEVVEQGKGEKIRVFTYKSKKRQRRTLGHRQSLTKVKIVSIGEPEKKEKPAVEKAAPKTAVKAAPKAAAKPKKA